MPIPVADIVTRASIILNDEDNVRWTLPELFAWIDDAACEIVVRRPQAGEITGTITLVAGPAQQLPEGGVMLMDVVRNVPGRSVSRVSRRLLDDQVPDWWDEKQSTRIKHYTLEQETPKSFYVYPPAKAGAVVEAKYSAEPPKVAALTDNVGLDRMYIGPIVSYVLYRAMAKDSEYANGAVAVTHFQAFTEALGTDNAVNQAVTQQAGTQ